MVVAEEIEVINELFPPKVNIMSSFVVNNVLIYIYTS